MRQNSSFLQFPSILDKNRHRRAGPVEGNWARKAGAVLARERQKESYVGNKETHTSLTRQRRPASLARQTL
jgi:hypothetical protein